MIIKNIIKNMILGCGTTILTQEKPLNISMLRGGVKIEKLLARLNARSGVKQHLMKSVSLLECDREQFCCKAV